MHHFDGTAQDGARRAPPPAGCPSGDARGGGGPPGGAPEPARGPRAPLPPREVLRLHSVPPEARLRGRRLQRGHAFPGHAAREEPALDARLPPAPGDELRGVPPARRGIRGDRVPARDPIRDAPGRRLLHAAVPPPETVPE